MLDDSNDEALEAGTETREENDLELTPEEVNAAYGLEEKGTEAGAPPGDTREESEKAVHTLETERTAAAWSTSTPGTRSWQGRSIPRPVCATSIAASRWRTARLTML